MNDIRKIDPKYVDENGVYLNLEVPLIFHLSDTEIIAMRHYYNNPKIAIKRKISVKSDMPILLAKKNSDKKKLKLKRSKIRNNKIYTKKKISNNNGCLTIILGGLVVTIFVYGNLIALEQFKEERSKNDKPFETYNNGHYYDVPDSQENNKEDESSIFYEENLQKLVREEERCKNIELFCDIYQLNYDVVYPNLVSLTENFSSEDYINGHIKGVFYQNIEVNAKNENELLLYAIRYMKYYPEKLGIGDSQIADLKLHKENKDEYSQDYFSQLDYVSEIMDVDRRLLYAIVKTDSGFSSIMFNEMNNPAELRNSETGEYYIFGTKAEGFFELAMEIKKYYHLINEDLRVIDYNILNTICEIHASGSEVWLEMVIRELEYIQLHEAEFFGNSIVNCSTIKM